MKPTPIQRLLKDIDAMLESKLEYETKVVLVSQIIAFAWRRETSRPKRHDDWMPDNAAVGQSDVTALLVQRKLGGGIMLTDVPGYGPHFYNVLSDGRRLGLTDRKFPAGTVIPEGAPITPAELIAQDKASPDPHYIEERLSLISDRFDEIARMIETERAKAAKPKLIVRRKRKPPARPPR